MNENVILVFFSAIDPQGMKTKSIFAKAVWRICTSFGYKAVSYINKK